MFSWGKKTGNRQVEDPSEEILRLVDESIGQAEDRFQKKLDILEFEWNETYEKFQRLHMKLSKRAKREDAIPPDGELQQPAEVGEEQVLSNNPGYMRLLNRR